MLENMKWLIEEESQRTQMAVLSHTNNFRSLLVGLISALLWAYPAYIVRLHRFSFLGYLLIMPAAIISTAALYLMFWPPQRQIPYTNALEILLASGWKQFLSSYLIIVFAPLQAFSVFLRRTIDDFGNGE